MQHSPSVQTASAQAVDDASAIKTRPNVAHSVNVEHIGAADLESQKNYATKCKSNSTKKKTTSKGGGTKKDNRKRMRKMCVTRSTTLSLTARAGIAFDVSCAVDVGLPWWTQHRNAHSSCKHHKRTTRFSCIVPQFLSSSSNLTQRVDSWVLKISMQFACGRACLPRLLAWCTVDSNKAD